MDKELMVLVVAFVGALTLLVLLVVVLWFGVKARMRATAARAALWQRVAQRYRLHAERRPGGITRMHGSVQEGVLEVVATPGTVSDGQRYSRPSIPFQTRLKLRFAAPSCRGLALSLAPDSAPRSAPTGMALLDEHFEIRAQDQAQLQRLLSQGAAQALADFLTRGRGGAIRLDSRNITDALGGVLRGEIGSAHQDERVFGRLWELRIDEHALHLVVPGLIETEALLIELIEEGRRLAQAFQLFDTEASG